MSRLSPLAVIALAACVGQVSTTPSEHTPETPAVPQQPATPSTSVPRTAGLTNAEAEGYLQRLSPMVVGRVMTSQEHARVQAEGESAVKPIITAWTHEAGFASAARLFLEQSLNVSGTKDGVDYSLPGNLAAKLAADGRPWREIITSEQCYGQSGAVIACDGDAPFKGGGVLTTRAYLKSRASRFNLTRASTMLRTFACRAYPLENALETRATKTELMGMFAASNAAEAEASDPRSVSGAANGSACYSCHGQFAFHTQLFVKFDRDGLYKAAADGVQDPAAELGRSKNGLMASHFAPGRAASEGSQVFGKPVANLAEAGKVIADSPTFIECTAEFFLNWSLGLQWGIIDYDRNLMKLVASSAREAAAQPSLGQVVVALYSEPLVMRSIVKKEPAP